MFDEAVIIPSRSIGSAYAVVVPGTSIGSSVAIPSSTAITGGPELAAPDPPSLLTPAPIARFEADYDVFPDVTGGGVSSWGGSVVPSGGETFVNGVEADRPIHSDTFNIKHGITFDGVGDYLQIDPSFLGAAGGVGSLAMVLKFNSTGSSQLLIQRSNSTPANKFFDVQLSSGKVFITYIKLAAFNYAVGAFTFLPNVVYVVIIRTTADTKEYEVFINGANDALTYLPGVDAQTGKWLSGDVGDAVVIGASRISSITQRPLDGSIAEVILWDSILSDPDVASINTCLTNKWAA